MALSKVNLTNAISGTLPAGNVNNATLDNVTSVPGAAIKGSMFLIKEQTASSDASISFVNGSSDVVLDSTYPIYKFEFINIHPSSSSDAHFQFQGNASGGSGYNETITSTYFRAYHNEGGTDTSLAYDGSFDQAQGTSFQTLMTYVNYSNDESGVGSLYLFNPSSTTFVKHFMAETQYAYNNPYSTRSFIAGYFNTTSAIDEIQFKFGTGNIDSGTIKLYGIKDS
jgi:hypothetical protein